MKIGILTYQRAHNYGALLQAYALKEYVHNLGHQSEIVDYWPNYHDEDYKIIPYFSSRSILGKIKAFVLLGLGYSKFVKRSNGYKEFIKEKLELSDSPMFRREDDMCDIEYDVVLYGSDQIWRISNYPLFNGFSDVYFGVYPLKAMKKISYAASMGVVDVDLIDKNYIKQMMKNFDAISVREDNLKEFVENTIGQTVSLVLDPVFLLSKEEWAQLAESSKRVTNDKYILFYHLASSREAIELTNKLKNHFGYKVIEIRGRVEPLLFGTRYLQTASPAEFVSLIQNAEIVVSTSYHGVAFSLIFEKQFYALGMGKNYTRALSLLSSLKISNRYLQDQNEVKFNDKLNYNVIRGKLDTQIGESKSFLKSSIVAKI